jgi:hypothetical protein
MPARSRLASGHPEGPILFFALRARGQDETAGHPHGQGSHRATGCTSRDRTDLRAWVCGWECSLPRPSRLADASRGLSAGTRVPRCVVPKAKPPSAACRSIEQGRLHRRVEDAQEHFGSWMPTWPPTAIPHDRLMAQVEANVSDGKVLDLFHGWLKADILKGLERWTPTQGSPRRAGDQSFAGQHLP